MGLCSVFYAPYAAYCHQGVARKCGFSDEQYRDALAGRVPSDLTAAESMAYHLGRTLSTQTSPLEDELWNQITAVMEKSEFVGLLHTIAGYRWVFLLEFSNGEDKRWMKPSD